LALLDVEALLLLLSQLLGLLEGTLLASLSARNRVISSSSFFALGGVAMRRMRRRLPASSIRSIALSGR